MNSQIDLSEQISKWQYLSNWVSIEELAKQCNSKRPLKKLKKFNDKLFHTSVKKYEAAINRIFLQKFILIAVAVETKHHLFVSKKLYERDGLIFGIYKYQTPGEESSRLTGVQMDGDIVDFQTGDKYKWFNSTLQVYYELIKENQAQQQEYKHWIKGILNYFDQEEETTPFGFLKALHKLPLNQHYVFKVKLQNAMLMPVFLKNIELKKLFCDTIQKEQILIRQIFGNQNGEFKEKFKELENLVQKIFDILYDHEKIGEAEEGPPFFKEINKSKSKDTTFTTNRKFAILLSRYRGITVVNQKQIPENVQAKDTKPCTKIQIKACNGSIQPISGNVIFVKLSWSIFQAERQTKLVLQCCNNRKVQEMYYEEVYNFWEKLEGNQKFRELLGIDKFVVSLNEDSENLEVVLSNYVPACLLTNSLKEIDKIVVLTLVLDEVIQLCERKGNEREDPKNFIIEPFMINHAIMRFQKAMIEVEKHCELLYKNINMSMQCFQ